jgi:hypothetical protein
MLEEGIYVLDSVMVSYGTDLIDEQFEGALFVTLLSAGTYRVASFIIGPSGEHVDLSTWEIDEHVLTPTKVCGDESTFLGSSGDLETRVIHSLSDGALIFNLRHEDSWGDFTFRKFEGS